MGENLRWHLQLVTIQGIKWFWVKNIEIITLPIIIERTASIYVFQTPHEYSGFNKCK